jgi:hypothetical protein
MLLLNAGAGMMEKKLKELSLSELVLRRRIEYGSQK